MAVSFSREVGAAPGPASAHQTRDRPLGFGLMADVIRSDSVEKTTGYKKGAKRGRES
jgi:hypothetical protein